MTAYDAATSLVDRWLSALYERQDLAEHLDGYHPAAWVVIGEQLTRREDLDPEAYGRAVADLLDGGGDPPHAFTRTGDGTLQVTDGEGLLRVPVRDLTDDRAFEAAFHLRDDGAGWRLLGCAVVTPGAPEPTVLNAAALVSAELAQASTVAPAGACVLTPLDLAVRRAFPPPVPLVALPEARFTCQDSGVCCTASHRIRVPEATRRVLDAVDWAALEPAGGPAFARPFFEPTDDWDPVLPYQLAKGAQGCTFHRGGGCTVHRSVGFNPMSTCALFPIGFTATPEGVALWSSFTCPTVRANVGQPLSERQEDMAARLSLVHRSLEAVPEQVSLVPGGAALPYAVYRAFEDGLLEGLSDTGASPAERVARAVGAVDRLVSRAAEGPCSEDEAGAIARAGREPLRTEAPHLDGLELPGLGLYLVLSKRLPAVLKGLEARRPLDDRTKLGLHRVLAASGVRYEPEPDLLTRYLRQVLFRKRWLAEFGVVASINMLALVEGLVRHAAVASALAEGRSVTNEADLQAAVTAADQATIHSQLLADGLLRHARFGALFAIPGAGLAG